MEEKYLKRFTPAMLVEALAHYGATSDRAEELDGFENFIYEFDQAGTPRILRLAHSSRRSADLIAAEADWINYLAEGGVSVAPVIPTDQGELVAAIDDGAGEAFLATAFVKAAGAPPWEVRWPPDEAYLEEYGALLGRMHALTQRYQAPGPQRFAWNAPVMMDAPRTLPASEAVAARKLVELIESCEDLPQSKDSYGLIHYDAHEGNMLMDAHSGKLTLIDFDDCCYGWFIQDLAIVLCHATANAGDREAYARRFLPPFLSGYARYNRLDPAWLAEMPRFLKIREIDLYGVIHRDLDVDNLDDPWCIRFMEDRKARIENDVPYLDMDFSEYERYLVP